MLKVFIHLVIISAMTNISAGRTLIPGNTENNLTSSYAFYHWYDPAVDRDEDNDATDTDKVTKHDTNTNIMSSVLHIFNNGDREKDDIFSSIYEDILEPVIKESIKRKEHSTENIEITPADHVKDVTDRIKIAQHNMSFAICI